MTVAAPPVSALTDGDSIRWSGKGVRAEAVAARLLDMRRAAYDEDGYPLTRASVMNLLVCVDRAEQVEEAIATVDELAVRHPSRAIVVAPQAGSTFSLDAELVLHRHPLAAHALAFERVLLKPRGASPEGLDTLVIPLLIPHLQSFLWWRGDPDPSDPAMRSLIAICDRLVIDSAQGAADRLGPVSSQLISPSGRLPEAARLVLGDMAWIRMEPFRDALAHVFDEAHRAELLAGVERIELVGARGARAPVSSSELLFAGWLASRLGFARPMAAPGGISLEVDSGNRATFAFTASRKAHRPPGPGMAPFDLHGLRLIASVRRQRIEVELTLQRGEAHVRVQDGTATPVSRTLPFVPLPEAEVLSRELARIGRDRVYEDALLWAARIHAALRK
ncbi:MAG: glucose-6-phosphate dehydrogenase assembly protein OpcA [Candidatus Dormibacteria bacterium]